MSLFTSCTSFSAATCLPVYWLFSNWTVWFFFFFYCWVYHFIYLKIFFFFGGGMWTIFKVFTEFVTILLLIYVLDFWLRGRWDLNTWTRYPTHTGRWSLKHSQGSLWEFFICFKYYSLSVIWLQIFFSQIVAYMFTFLTGSMFLDPFLDDVHFINFAFDGLCFWSHITLHKAQSPESHLLFFFPKGFYSFTFYIKVHDLFWVNLCTSWRITLKFSFLPVDVQLIQCRLLKKLSFIELLSQFLSKNQISIILRVYF